MAVDMSTRWRDKGFLDRPVLQAAAGGERMYRVWGGKSKELGEPKSDGVFFTLTRYESRTEAERALAVMEYGNSVRRLSTFVAKPKLPAWVGRVHPGERPGLFGNTAGSQVFVEREYLLMLEQEGTAVLLRDDMVGTFVVAHEDTTERVPRMRRN